MSGSLGSGGNRTLRAMPIATALQRWPPAPKSFSPAEQQQWKRLGKLALAARTVSAADLMVCEMCATAMARYEQARQDPKIKLSTINTLMRNLQQCLNALGLSPLARRAVEALPRAAPPVDDDPLSEFFT